ncbi:DoxX family membrane protein [Rarobacter incanus]|uniref:DoxX-like protein n=1 Tax=Rarobacter incanus TaxID=153494 RepID=A0A542SPK3_9MICO|nr:DoxX family membrane protein [Rarobacter incanus]TQK76187.1 DoxX-like protein [Rarobacter incanus]
MAALGFLARALVSVPFIVDSAQALKNSDEHSARAAMFATHCPLAEHAPTLTPGQWKLAVRGHAVATIVCSLGLVGGKAPRLHALMLAALTAPRVAISMPRKDSGTPFAAGTATPWKSLASSLGQVGAALAIAADRHGKPSRQWLHEHQSDA